MSRTIARDGGMVTVSASYLYDAAGRVIRVNYGNGTAVVRVYDAADRPMQIQYLDAAANAYLNLDYTLSADGLVTRIVETALSMNGLAMDILLGGFIPSGLYGGRDDGISNRPLSGHAGPRFPSRSHPP